MDNLAATDTRCSLGRDIRAADEGQSRMSENKVGLIAAVIAGATTIGAAIGAVIGSIAFPGAGTLIGAKIGAALGGGAGGAAASNRAARPPKEARTSPLDRLRPQTKTASNNLSENPHVARWLVNFSAGIASAVVGYFLVELLSSFSQG